MFKREVRVIVAGTRTFKDYALANKSIKEVLGERDFGEAKIRIISGGAKGGDEMGEIFARQHALLLTRKPAKWNLYGKKAGYIRNEEMAEFATEKGHYPIAIVFWDGMSSGTKHMINIANAHGIECHVILY